MEPILPKVKKIGSMLTTLLAGQDGEVAIVAFDHRIRTMQDFTNDTDKLRVALDNIRPGSEYSVMKDAVNDSVRMLRSRPKDRRKVILLISETRDKSSSGKTREILANIQFQNILVYTVNVNRLITTLAKKTPVPRPDPIPPGGRHVPAGMPNTPTTTASMGTNLGSVIPLFVEIFKDVKDVFVDNPAEVFTKFTGGREYSFVSQKDLENAIQGISDELHSQYILSYNPNNKIEGGWHDIKVLVVRQDTSDWKVRTRPGYWMAGVPE
jgi:VWFA-related protein